MKKLLTFTLAITIGLAGMAQGKSNGKGHAKKADKHQKHANKNGTYDDRYDRDDVNHNRQNTNGKYSKNLPAKVRSAFNSDYPNATNVTWTKANGHWTATFPNGVFRRSVTYAANGQRVNNNATSRRTTNNNQEGSIWDKILTRE